MHVSKPPKEGSPSHKFLTDLQRVSSLLNPEVKVEMVHKKINLAHDTLAWEHERFSIGKLSAFTLSHYDTPFHAERSSMLDVKVDEDVVLRNTRIVAETLACSAFGLQEEQCAANIFTAEAGYAPSKEAIRSHSGQLAARPRGTPLTLGLPEAIAGKRSTSGSGGRSKHQKSSTGNKNPTVKFLSEALRTFTHEAREISYKRDKKDPEYTFYDASVDSGNNEEAVVMTAYKVKPAVFDLVVSIGIAAYLGALYLFLQQASSAYSVLAAALSSGLSATSSPAKTNSNGVNGHSSNGKVKTH